MEKPGYAFVAAKDFPLVENGKPTRHTIGDHLVTLQAEPPHDVQWVHISAELSVWEMNDEGQVVLAPFKITQIKKYLPWARKKEMTTSPSRSFSM